ncbi:uncharacterized protein LOC129571348 [Sitodiplosis mosellana]|uniref:uncharacterized protein LOC129571348 n=1 Tax=Sitodiplosis mosellana TaxID=263140 RepID=UPI0024449908|nr:uncharacterized protein LOC129571348 [Sitodiplosis mosellana]
MIKKEEAAKDPIKVKIYDFQLCYYQSFVCDLTIFLFMSVCCDILKEQFKSFINFYHSEFLMTLQLVNCPLEDYTYEKMWFEIQDKAKRELMRVLFVVKNSVSDENSTLDKISQDAFFRKDGRTKSFARRWKCILEIFTENGLI